MYTSVWYNIVKPETYADLGKQKLKDVIRKGQQLCHISYIQCIQQVSQYGPDWLLTHLSCQI